MFIFPSISLKVFSHGFNILVDNVYPSLSLSSIQWSDIWSLDPFLSPFYQEIPDWNVRVIDISIENLTNSFSILSYCHSSAALFLFSTHLFISHSYLSISFSLSSSFLSLRDLQVVKIIFDSILQQFVILKCASISSLKK